MDCTLSQLPKGQTAFAAKQLIPHMRSAIVDADEFLVHPGSQHLYFSNIPSPATFSI